MSFSSKYFFRQVKRFYKNYMIFFALIYSFFEWSKMIRKRKDYSCNGMHFQKNQSAIIDFLE